MKRLLAAIFLLFTFLFPVCTAEAVTFSANVTDPYGPSSGRKNNWHNGVDLGAAYGTVIPSLFSGTVYGDQTGYGINPDGYGNMIAIISDDGSLGAVYGHVQAIYVEAGQHVEAGEAIGEVGSAGTSTGPHLHLQLFSGAPYASGVAILDPNEELSNSPYYSIDGDISNNTIGGHFGVYVRKVIPSIDANFTTYFSPSEVLETTCKNILNQIVPVFDFAENNLVSLLAILALIDFSWYMIPAVLGITTRQNLSGAVIRLIRYGFWFFLFMSWHNLVSTMFIPFVENITSSFTGHAFTETSFLHFDELFVAVSQVISAFLHVDSRFGLMTGIFICILVTVILGLTIIATMYMMYKLIIFYLMCAFGVLGIPLYFMPKMEAFGKSFISGIICSAFDLIVTAFIFVFIIGEVSSMTPIDQDSVSSLLLFTCAWGFLVFFIPSFTNHSIDAFRSLWD